MQRKSQQSGTMQQDFYYQEASKPKFYQTRIDPYYQDVNHELNQNIRIEQSLAETGCEMYSDSRSDVYIQI